MDVQRDVVEVHSCLPEAGSSDAVWLPDSSQLVQVVIGLPDVVAATQPASDTSQSTSAQKKYLRVIDPAGKSVRYIPVALPKQPQKMKKAAPYSIRRGSKAHTTIAGLSSGNLISVEESGAVSVWQLRHDDVVK